MTSTPASANAALRSATFVGSAAARYGYGIPRWPELVHPFASAVDTPLPKPPERTHLMLAFKARWVEVRADPQDKQYAHYPKESIAVWHQRLGLVDES